MRIGIAGLWHETNTFAVEQNDTLDANVRESEEIVAHAAPRGFVGGFLEGARRPGVEIIPTVEVRFTHGGIIHARVYEHYRQMIVEGLRQAGPLDAVYFALHGAMAAEDPYTDAEGELLRAAREALGDVPFVATYDFHTIMSDREAATLAAAFPNNTNPHIDGYERGLEAAQCSVRMLQGEIRPVTRRVAVPIIGPNIGQSTWSHLPEEERQLPLYQLNLVREEMERIPGIST